MIEIEAERLNFQLPRILTRRTFFFRNGTQRVSRRACVRAEEKVAGLVWTGEWSEFFGCSKYTVLLRTTDAIVVRTEIKK